MRAATQSDRKLALYRSKRRFAQTPEPRGSRSTKPGRRYLIQKHDASRLHYDFRLELDGVLKSWAVTRGPSLDPGQKRLAVRTEDHPIDYAEFEGTIPEGNYGAGTVMLWDRGHWEPLTDPHEGLSKGKVSFVIRGERLRGRWALVRMRGGEKPKENWLLIKERDEQADRHTDVLAQFDTSVKSGRDLTEIANARKRRRKELRPKQVVNDSKGPEIAAGIRLTHPDRVLYAGQNITKRDLAHYLEEVADIMLPHAGKRLLSLVRCPEGTSKECFFQRHASPGFPKQVLGMKVAERAGTHKGTAGLIAMAQVGVLELHIWGSRKDDIEKPDRIVFDLDPDVSVSFETVKRAAYAMREALEELGLRSFPLLTGGKGVHVVAPLLRRHAWPVVKDFCRKLAERFEREDPQNYVATMSKARRNGRIFIDYLRNDRGASAIAPMSTRVRAGAPIAWPVNWDDLRRFEAPNTVLLKDAVNRLDEAAAAWKGYFEVKQSLKRSALAEVGI